MKEELAVVTLSITVMVMGMVIWTLI